MRYALWRLAVGERGRNLRHLLAVTLGIALAAFVLLEAFATSNALTAQSSLMLTRDGSGSSELEPDKVPLGDDLLLRSSSIVLTKQGPLTVTLLARQGTGGSFDLPGLSELPPVGSVLVSPALAGGLSNEGNVAQELSGWLPAAPTGVLARAALASPTELVAIAVVRPAELRRSGRFEVVNPANPFQLDLGGTPRPEAGNPFLIVLAAVAILVPVASLIAISVRLSASRRDRRYATLRLLGATPGDVRALVVLEAAVASVLAFTLALSAAALIWASDIGLSVGGVDVFTRHLVVRPDQVVIALAVVVCTSCGVATVAAARLDVAPLQVQRRSRRSELRRTRAVWLVAGWVVLCGLLQAGSCCSWRCSSGT